MIPLVLGALLILPYLAATRQKGPSAMNRNDLLGLSLKKIARKAGRVARGVARASVKAADPRTALKVTKQIVKNPTKFRKNLKALAQLDPGIRASVAVAKGLRSKNPRQKRAAARAVATANARAQAGDPAAAKVVDDARNLTAAVDAAESVVEQSDADTYAELPEETEGLEEAEAEAQDQKPGEEEPAEGDDGDMLGYIEINDDGDLDDEELALDDDSYDLLGWSPWGKIRRIPWGRVAALAQKVGPAIATVYPPAAPFVAAGMVALKAARAGDPKAIAKIAEIKRGAAAGDERSAAALAALQTAETVRTAVKTA